MVETYNDDEQLQRLREWWQQNWLPVVLGLGLAIGGVLGWNMWGAYQKEQSELASGHFEQLRLNLQIGDMGAATEQVDILKSKYRGTPYAAEAALLVASAYANSEDLERAASQLEWVVNYAGDSKLQHLGRLRLARVRWAQGDADAALALIQAPKLESFAGLFAELRGDILVGQGKDAEAREAYKLAMQSAEVSDLAVLQQKLADLIEQGSQADETAEEATEQ